MYGTIKKIEVVNNYVTIIIEGDDKKTYIHQAKTIYHEEQWIEHLGTFRVGNKIVFTGHMNEFKRHQCRISGLQLEHAF